MIRKIDTLPYKRERLETPDNDFVDLDWIKTVNDNNNRLIIISHGLEGGSNRTYVKGLASLALENSWDILAWNCRSCSGEMNLKPRFYHHGDSTDLASVLSHVSKSSSYSEIVLVGYSMGGSMTTKYLGEGVFQIPTAVKCGIAISTPFDLKGSAAILDGPGMGFYRNRFLKKLGKKIFLKSQKWPEIISHEGFDKIKSFRDFDNRYTAPLHHFKDADDFYKTASANQYLEGITHPFLILNAQNDPFLTKECFPIKIAQKKSNINLDMPGKGGHVGFLQARNKYTWSEKRVFEFIQQISTCA